MRNLPRFALVPLAVLVSIIPFTVPSFVGPAGADTAADCEVAFSSPADRQLVYTTDPAERLAFTGQTVRLSGSWDPAAWDSLSSAVACVRVDETFDDVLGVSQPTPGNGGAFEHSFTIPETVDPGTRLCTRIRLAGDPAGEATEAVRVTKEHCFEVDHHEEEAPPSDDDTTTPTTSAPSTTTSTVPTASPATSTGTPSDDSTDGPASPDGSGSPVGTPFDTAEATPPAAPGTPLDWPETPGIVPLLPATGNGSASLTLYRHGTVLLFTGLALLVAFGLPRRRPRSTS